MKNEYEYEYLGWKIKKDNGLYHIYQGKKHIDSCNNFNEAYTLLLKYKESVK